MDAVWINVGAVAHILGLSARAVRKLAHTERWPTRIDTPTKAILYRRSDVLAYKAHYRSTKGAAPEPSTPGEAQKLLEWARQVRMEAAMLRIVLNGAAYCDIDEQGEFVLVGLGVTDVSAGLVGPRRTPQDESCGY